MSKDVFNSKLEALIASAKRLRVSGFGNQEPEEATKTQLLEPLFEALGYQPVTNQTREYKILGDSVDYLLKSDRPLIFVEAKSLHDCQNGDLFEKHREQVMRYIQNYRLSPEVTRMDRPVSWIVLTNFAQFHFIRVNETTPTFFFKLDDLWQRREELWELFALENVDANRIDEVYDQQNKASLDQQFLADLKRWRLLIANGFALRQPARPLDEITLASQQLLDRFIFCRMLETRRLVEYNKLARAYSTYLALYARADKNFSEVIRESLFIEIKNDFNTELFEQPLLCDGMQIDNAALAAVIGHEPLAPELAATCGFESGQGELMGFRHLYSYDFSLMSQDVMGAVYERFLAHKLSQTGGRIVIEDTDDLRKKEGIYYTPKYIVDYIVAQTVGEKIKPILGEAKTLLGYKNFKGAHAKIRALSQIRVLDPAMGSGSFLLVAFDTLVDAYFEYNEECRRIKKERNGHGALFDADFALAEEIFNAPLQVLTENIFGVDLDKQAVEVAKLNLWLRYMTVNRDPFFEQLQRKQRGGKPLNLLPNLTKNLKRGNSLIADVSVAGDAAFDWRKEFAEIMERGGFEVVIGNPPYGAFFSAEEAVYLASNFRSFQKGVRDVYACFLEQSFRLGCRDAKTGFIVPSAWLGGPDYQVLRQELLKWTIEIIIDLPFDVFSDAYVDTAIAIFSVKERDKANTVRTFAYPKIFKIENIQIAAGGYGSVSQEEWCNVSGNKFILDSTAHKFIVRVRERNRKQLGDYIEMKRGVLFGAELLTSEKCGPQSHPYFEGDIYRYTLKLSLKHWVVFDDKIKERPAEFDWFSGPRILLRRLVNRRQRLMATFVEETFITNKNLYSIRGKSGEGDLKAILGIVNSRLISFLYTRQITQSTKDDFPQVTIEDVRGLPCPELEKTRNTTAIATLVKAILECRSTLSKAVDLFERRIHHSNRTPCNLAHYLQQDFAQAVKPEILIDDVQRTGFIHRIGVESNGADITVSATVAAAHNGTARLLPVLRLAFKNDLLRQFVYACWHRFMDEHSRQKRWTKGKKPEAIYPLLVNILEPLVYLEPSAGDNLRAIGQLMKAVADEAGTADLAAVEAEIGKLDGEIDALVYELYELTPEEIKVVEGVTK